MTLELSPEQQDGTGREKTILSRGHSKAKALGWGGSGGVTSKVMQLWIWSKKQWEETRQGR